MRYYWYIMYDFWDYCNAVRRNVLATTLFIAVVRVNETKFLSNLTLSSFSASAYVANPALEADLGGIEGWGGGAPPPPLKGGPRHNRPKLLHLHRSPPNTCYARGNSGSSPLPFEIWQETQQKQEQEQQQYFFHFYFASRIKIFLI